ncbi:CRTAC1 family protein [Mesobaculum littorinae]|uniref:CRTAC1 family protein n=1 Tax=Mesobaculum littorinae TaxID=2486419 RepID=A0A438AEB7_9RHOB|nr:VCBS repeat-containing protein [Mesobaculum littorinae]RVV97008.1 CRTAC1 family protein [Mesobaculum littorinae]
MAARCGPVDVPRRARPGRAALIATVVFAALVHGTGGATGGPGTDALGSPGARAGTAPETPAEPPPTGDDGPLFLDRSAALPGPHVYAGGWEHFVGGGVAAFDCNGDGFPDLAAAGGSNPARLFVNATASPGAPLAFRAGEFPRIDGVTGLYPLDIDGDAILDLAVLRVGANLLLQGQGDCRFRDAGSTWGFDGSDRWTTAFAATFEPGRDMPTLAFGNYVDRDDPEGPFGTCDVNHLYRGAGGRYAAPHDLSPGFCALSMLFTDWRRQGRAALRVSNDRHYYVRGGAEQLWQMAPLRLAGPEDGWPQVSLWGMGIASRDLDGDGWAEVMTTSMGDQLLQLAEPGGGYRNAPYEIGTYAQRPWFGDDGRPSTGWHAEFGDIDNDGRDDLFIAKGNVDQMPSNAAKDPNNLLMQRPDGRFAEAADRAGIATTDRSRGAALADLNRDGRLDLVVVNRRAPMELWENATRAGHWLSVAVTAPPPNTGGLGSFVELETSDGRRQTRELTVGGGHAGGAALPLHFGLGEARTARLRAVRPGPRPGAWDIGPWVEVQADAPVMLDLGKGMVRPAP